MDVYFFGAGASAAEGAPATRDFFARAWQLLAPDFDQPIRAVWRFLESTFRVELTGPGSFAFLPTVDEVISLVDWSLHVNQGLGFAYDPPRLYQVRRDLEHLLCATLGAALEERRSPGGGPHARFVQALLTQRPAGSFALVSLNYDTLLDEALAEAGAGPNYGLRDLDLAPGQGPLLAKLHGSLNWGLCPACGRIVAGARQRRRSVPAVCTRCGNDRLRSLIISPTLVKSYESAHLQHVWDLALECIQRAERLIFVGYSLPPADIAIYQLIRRGLLVRTRGAWPQVAVVNRIPGDWSDEQRRLKAESVADRFTRLFGPGIICDFQGFHGQI
jgi:NAD-dependent SIR2 family protein deacetylase